MALIAKRKTTETWREALAARAKGDPRCLGRFDEQVAAGMTEAEAAYRALAAFDLLWQVEGLEDPGARPSDVQLPRGPHEVPNV